MNLPQLPDGLELPHEVKRNAIKALASGVANLITATIDIPTAYLERITQNIRAKSNGELAITQAAVNRAIGAINDNPDFANRALDYFSSKILQEQRNRENIAHKFLQNIEGNLPVRDTENIIDDDWLTIFWRLAENKSSEDIQGLLAKLLVSEVKNPKSVSPNTLQLLSVMTSDLGKCFERLCCISIDDGTSVYVIHPNVFAFQNIGPLDEYGISYNDLFELDGAGLIRSAETIMFNYKKMDTPIYEDIDFSGLKAKINLSGKQIRVIQFTRAGKELRRLIALTPVEAYKNRIKEKFGDNLEFI